MKVIVTGGGGFLGKRICIQLLEAGHDVISLSRSTYPELDRLGVKQITCDLSKKIEVDQKLIFADAIIHTAAKAGVWGREIDYYNINFLGTKHLVDKAIKLGVTKFIYTSSPSVIFVKDDLFGVDETTDYPKEYLNHYASTKALAEKYVLSLSSDSFKCCALRPHLIWGEGDPHILPRLVQKSHKGKIKIIGTGDNLVDVIYVDNAASAHVKALEHIDANPAINGNSYFLGQSEAVNLWMFINSLLDTQGIERVEKRISYKFAYNLGAMFEKIFMIFNIYDRDPPMTRFVATQMAKNHYFSHAKAKRDFGYSVDISTQQGLERLR
jgi:2-alkyl-3-oxoalkanoate reductase